MSLPARAPRSRARGGFTLFEVIVAIVLLVALVSLSMPVVSSRLDAEALDAALDRSATHVILARAYAQATGEPVEILHDADRHAWIARRFVVDETAFGAGSGGGDAGAVGGALEEGLDFADSFMDPDDERAIPEGWALEVLPRRVQVSFTQPEAADGGGASDTGPATLDDAWLDDAETLYDLPDDGWDDLGPRELERFAVILPDGTALLSRPAWIVSNDGRAARIEVHPWSSTLMVGAVEAPVRDESESESEEERIDDSPDGAAEDRGARDGSPRDGSSRDGASPSGATRDDASGADRDAARDGEGEDDA